MSARRRTSTAVGGGVAGVGGGAPLRRRPRRRATRARRRRRCAAPPALARAGARAGAQPVHRDPRLRSGSATALASASASGGLRQLVSSPWLSAARRRRGGEVGREARQVRRGRPAPAVDRLNGSPTAVTARHDPAPPNSARSSTRCACPVSWYSSSSTARKRARSVAPTSGWPVGHARGQAIWSAKSTPRSSRLRAANSSTSGSRATRSAGRRPALGRSFDSAAR